MRSIIIAAFCLTVQLALPGSTGAHHSVSGQFDIDTTQTWTGVISRIEWINPHIYLHLDVTEADGSVTTWQMETLTPAMMRRGGLTREMMMGQGGEVTVFGHPARKTDLNRGFILKLTYPEGHHYQLGDIPPQE